MAHDGFMNITTSILYHLFHGSYPITITHYWLHPSNMSCQWFVSCISKQWNRELCTTKIAIYYYSSPWEMICFGLVKADHCLPLPSFIKEICVKCSKTCRLLTVNNIAATERENPNNRAQGKCVHEQACQIILQL